MSTAVLEPVEFVADPPQPARHRPRWALVVTAAAVGILVVGLSYRFSTEGRAPQLYYATFWVGMLLAVVPVAGLLLGHGARPATRMTAVGLLSLITAVPKYLRNPSAPSYHDEYAHWRQAVDVLSSGHLFRPNALIPIVQYFPGTSAITAAVQRLSGLSVWSSGQLLVLAVHVLSVFAVYVLVSCHLRSNRAAGIAALVYGLNPSAIYFDTQYAYESVSIGLFLWTLALGSLAARSHTRRARTSLLCAAVLCSCGCIVTHHLTTLALLGILFGIAVVVGIGSRRRRRPARRAADQADAVTAPVDSVAVWWALFGITAAVAVLWLVFVAWNTVSYLSPYVGGSVTQLSSIGSGGGGGRKLLAANAEPTWERAFTALSPLVAGLVSLRCLQVMRRTRGLLSSAGFALVLFGLIYIPSVPFVLAPSGAEGARRSWAFTYVGIALIFALVATRTPRVRARRRRVDPVTRVRRGVAGWMVLVLVLLVGNVGGGLNDPYRFPGPFLWGSDTRSASAEARTVAQLLSADTGRVRIVTDRYTALEMIAYGGLDVAAADPGFPVWQLVESTSTPDRRLIEELVTSGYEYLIVDTRMYSDQAFNGNNFGPADPYGAGPVPKAALTYLDSASWTTLVMSTEHLRVYRMNFANLSTGAGR